MAERPLVRIEGKLDRLLEGQARTDEALKAHVAREGGCSIHHEPPCQYLTDYLNALSNKRRLFIAALAAGAAVASVLYSFLS